MIVVEVSVFIDLLFEYNTARTHSADDLFTNSGRKGPAP